MLKLFLRLFGKRMVHKAVANHTSPDGFLDVRFGFALLRDRRVPFGAKAMALGLGAAIVALLISLELPLEGLWALLLPLIAVPLDFVVDGMEAVIGPILLGALLLPFLAPRHIIDRIRQERLGVTPGTVIDVESHAAQTPPRAHRWRLVR